MARADYLYDMIPSIYCQVATRGGACNECESRQRVQFSSLSASYSPVSCRLIIYTMCVFYILFDSIGNRLTGRYMDHIYQQVRVLIAICLPSWFLWRLTRRLLLETRQITNNYVMRFKYRVARKYFRSITSLSLCVSRVCEWLPPSPSTPVGAQVKLRLLGLIEWQ